MSGVFYAAPHSNIKGPAGSRTVERNLLFLAALYLLAGIMTLYLGEPGVRVVITVAAGLTVAAVFLLIHFYWKVVGFRGDHYLLPVTAVLISTGLVFLFRLDPYYGVRQFIWILLGLGTLVFTSRVLLDIRFLGDYKYIYALLGLIALILPIFFGKVQGGAKSWLDFGYFQLQPSEFVKILLVLFLASYLAENRNVLAVGTRSLGGISLPGLSEWAPLVVMWGISLLLLVFQRDLGAALIYFGTFLAIVYAATARIFYVLFGLGLFIAGASASYYLFDHVRARVLIWLNPWPYIDNIGYQITQSLFAIGSGGALGVGLGQGYPGYIPLVHSDFIFPAICEELGLLGGAGIIILFMILIFRGVKIALRARDEFSALVAIGLTSLLGLQAFIIIAGVTKLLPLTGVTLPYISYGGSSLVANFILLGLLLNISHEADDSL
ncbi:MAG: FtsW/RodA/SpoVE family cell cycle protein [Desulfotomaculaceae bacterium]|nr:FtsW/RodA/SpoVE family cell cycle protein [Desulfotomaculaceae bacterium]